MRGAAVSLLICSLFCPSLPLWAQVTTGKPIKIKIKTPKPKRDSFQGEVLNFTPAAITVRDRKNMALVRTFSYSPELAQKLENRRMEPGERVTVVYLRGTETAVEVKGKIRKADLPLIR